MRKVQSDNGHLWYAKDSNDFIVQVSMFEEQIDAWLLQFKKVSKSLK